ncbi:MAG TPA: DinB family protein [Bryobacteraceae bacterium]|nr:DinB family protein [Bryobacteraceae bacterium]
MTYYGAKDLADSFRTVRKNTIIVAEEIPESQYGFRATPETRTVAQTLYHVAAVPRVQQQIHAIERRNTLEGFDFPGLIGRLIAEEQAPRTKSQIVTLLREEGERWASWTEQLSDDFLAERVQYPAGMSPASKTRFEMLIGVKEHEMHHRAQLMLMERMVGIVPHLTRQMQERMAAITKATATS